MNELEQIYAGAKRFTDRRAELARNLKNQDTEHARRNQELNARHEAAVRQADAERNSANQLIESRSQKSVAEYTAMKKSLQDFLTPVMHLCPKDKVRTYVPNASRVNEKEVNDLVRMIQEQGILAWIKRTFHLGGYSSKENMAFEAYCKIEDACAFCNGKIAEAENRSNSERQQQATAARRKKEALQQNLIQEREAETQRYEAAKKRAMEDIRRFDNSEELRDMFDRIGRLQTRAKDACGAWGEYTAPRKMPEEVQLCSVGVSLPDRNGIQKNMELPLMVNLFESNLIILTDDSSRSSEADCRQKQMVRSLLARLMKITPPGNCSYSIFDSLHKGASLERLIDITNVGTTDIHFDLFTGNDRGESGASCAERRKFLRGRPAEVIKYTAGKYHSLFDFNRETESYEFPFTWIVDFNFPDEPDKNMLEDFKELFVNASAAGYSFVFVTTQAGFKQLSTLASQYFKSPFIHIDCRSNTFTQGNFSHELVVPATPSKEQIYNFVTATKNFYDDGGAVNNRIDEVFARNGIHMRDASKKLSIPMALNSRGKLIDIEFGGEGSVHGFISGGTNSGKSTLLHTIILSACLHYTPMDLEIWLIDYKQAEFFLYKKKTPPHIKLIGVSKTADFTFSLLDRIIQEADRRTELMNRFEAQNLTEYRTHAGEPGYVPIPRLLLVIDEFHEMSQFVAADMEYKDKLENVLREYRAQGITCLLADQTFSTGLSGLTLAAKNQIGLRIAMRNEQAKQEVKDTLEVDRALYSDSMERTISTMSQGDFIMKVYVRNARGEITDMRLEKFKALFAKGTDIAPIAKALQQQYKGQFRKDDVLYVNTRDQVGWSDADIELLDRMEKLRYPNMRLYLGRPATLRPCFGLDLGRQPDENLSILGGTAQQRWELLTSVIRSCVTRSYPLYIFASEYSDLMSDFGSELHDICEAFPQIELMETTEQWCAKMTELESILDARQSVPDCICLFIGLEIANAEFSRLPEKGKAAAAPGGFAAFLMNNVAQPGSVTGALPTASTESSEYNVMPIVNKLFSNGSRCGIRCVAEVSVYRQFTKIQRISEMCRHKVAFSMSSDDCLMYLGNSAFQKSIGNFAVYNNGGKEVKKLLPYRF